MTSVRVLALDVLDLAVDDHVLFFVDLLDAHDDDVGRLRDDGPETHRRLDVSQAELRHPGQGDDRRQDDKGQGEAGMSLHREVS